MSYIEKLHKVPEFGENIPHQGSDCESVLQTTTCAREYRLAVQNPAGATLLQSGNEEAWGWKGVWDLTDVFRSRDGASQRTRAASVHQVNGMWWKLFESTLCFCCSTKFRQWYYSSALGCVNGIFLTEF